MKHCWNIVKHHETLVLRCDNIGARCGDVCDRAELPAILARSYRRYRRGVFGDIGDCGVGITPQMCNRVTNHGDMGQSGKIILPSDIEISHMSAVCAFVYVKVLLKIQKNSTKKIQLQNLYKKFIFHTIYVCKSTESVRYLKWCFGDGRWSHTVIMATSRNLQANFNNAKHTRQWRNIVYGLFCQLATFFQTNAYWKH